MPKLFYDFTKLTLEQQKHIVALFYMSLPDDIKNLTAVVNCVEGFENGLVGFSIDTKGFITIQSIRNVQFINSLQGNFTQRPDLIKVVKKHFNFVHHRYLKMQKDKDN